MGAELSLKTSLGLAFPATCAKAQTSPGSIPESGELTRLFNPRLDAWPDHFVWEGVWLRGKTPVGRATVAVLDINHPDSLLVREALLDEGIFARTPDN